MEIKVCEREASKPPTLASLPNGAFALTEPATTLLSNYVIWEARNLGVSRVAIGRMLTNLAIHTSVGAIPIFGDVFDAFFRVNQRNMRIVRAQLDKLPKRTGVQ